MRLIEKGLFYWRGYTQALFFVGLVVYAWFFPLPAVFKDTWVDSLFDVVGVVTIALGQLLRLWAVSHMGKGSRSRRIRALRLVSSGPYEWVRNPIYLGNFFIGMGLVIFAGAFLVLPLYFCLFVLQYRFIVTEEEDFLHQKFGAEYLKYQKAVPRWFPRVKPGHLELRLGGKVPWKEAGTLSGVLVGSFFFEWLEVPSHRLWLTAVHGWLKGFLA